MSIRSLTLSALVSLLGLAGCTLLPATPARAAVVHEYLKSFAEEVPATTSHGEPVPSPGRLVGTAGITLDSGELYVVDHGSSSGVGRLDVFDTASGALLRQFPELKAPLYYFQQSVAVGHATGETEVYDVGDEQPQMGRVAVTDAAGNLQNVWTGEDTPSKGFGCFQCSGDGGSVAVDNSAGPDGGDVYVADEAHQVVDVFKPLKGGGEEYLTQITGPEQETNPQVHFSNQLKVAVSSFNGDVLIADKQVVYVLEPMLLGSYKLVQRLTGTPNGAFGVPVSHVTVDSGNGDVYLALQTGIICEYDSQGNYLGRIAETPRGALTGELAIAVDPVTHDLYVTDRKEATSTQPASDVVDVFGPNIAIPDVADLPASGATPQSATFNGTVDPDEAGEATCRFEWGTTTEFGKVAPCEPESVANGNSPLAVQASVSGLQPDTTYYYRLQATNKANGHTNPGEAAQDQAFVTPGPGLEGESVANVSSTAATFNATINPHNAPARYYFQYGTSTSYGTDVPAAPGVPVGAGEGGSAVEQHVQGLQPGTIYHYRVVVVSEPQAGVFETFIEPDATFTTQPSGSPFAVADARQWEMVSPPQKNGASLSPISEQNGLIVAAGAGDALAYVAYQPDESDAKGFAGKMQELATRRAGGWEQQTISIPHNAATGPSVGFGPEYRFFSNDLSVAAVQPFGVFDPELSPEASEPTAYLHTDFSNGHVDQPCVEACFRPLATGKPGYANVPPGTVLAGRKYQGGVSNIGPMFVGATPDMHHMVLSSEVGLTEGEGSRGGLYEWSGGKLTFVGVGQLGNRYTRGARHAISADGSRVVFYHEQEGLFMRDTVTGSLLKLDAVQGGSSKGEGAAAFQGASNDGSKVFFTDANLTANSGGGRDLYECEILEGPGNLKCKLSDLTPIVGGSSAEVQEVIGESEDGSWVYFAALGSLGTSATPGKLHLFVLHDNGTSWEPPKLISAISQADLGGEEPENLAHVAARVSPNGEWLAFMSSERLTGYDNRDARSQQPDAEVYLYSASSGRLVCASCDPTGARPVGVPYRQLESGNGGLAGGSDAREASELIAANVPSWQQTEISGGTERYQSRYLEDGGRLFFNSDDALVPEDVNGTEDVYEYEPPGVGNCTTSSTTFSTRSSGCVDLVSSGTSAEESAFLDASESGGDVFFLTLAKLAPQDFDTSLDIYDAHECTAAVPCFPATPGVPPPCSTGDACKPSPTPQPAIFGAPSSATFSGAGNIAPNSSGGGTQSKSKPQDKVQKLARALKACRKKRGHGQRAACERKARARYASRPRKANTTNGKRG